MRYTVHGRSQSIITAALAILLAVGVQVSAASRAHAGEQAGLASPRSGHAANRESYFVEAMRPPEIRSRR
jgi:hypothetical protein